MQFEQSGVAPASSNGMNRADTSNSARQLNNSSMGSANAPAVSNGAISKKSSTFGAKADSKSEVARKASIY